MNAKIIYTFLTAVVVLLTLLAVEGAWIVVRLSNPENGRVFAYQNASLNRGFPYAVLPLNADGTVNVRVREMPSDTRVYIAGIGSRSVWGPNLPVEIKEAECRAFNGCEIPVRLENFKYGLKLPVEVK